MSEPRQEFLIEMYKQLLSDINRHIMIVWQSISVLVGAFAVFALVEKKIISLDVATSIIVLLSGWLYAHLLDASYWYNRNLVIIANIERQFLVLSDLKDIHYYFGAHRPNNKMITHLQIQLALGFGLAGLVLLFHFLDRVAPGLGEPLTQFDPQRALPYVLAAFAFIYGGSVKKHRDDSYKEFLSNSPGIAVNTSGITYGKGHGHGSEGGG